MRSAAVSPDGRWLAGGNHENPRGIRVRVWEVTTGREVATLPVAGLCRVGFSPDGRWLLTNGGGYRLWRVGTWEPGPSIGPEWEGGDFAFARQSRLVALSGKYRDVRLVDLDSGKELARLTVPEETRVNPDCFSPDESRLVARGHDSGLLYIWDLRALRAGLKSLGLDWNRPDYPAPIPPGGQIEVRVDMGTLGAPSKPEG
jgi:WD40 repeat protein